MLRKGRYSASVGRGGGSGRCERAQMASKGRELLGSNSMYFYLFVRIFYYVFMYLSIYIVRDSADFYDRTASRTKQCIYFGVL